MVVHNRVNFSSEEFNAHTHKYQLAFRIPAPFLFRCGLFVRTAISHYPETLLQALRTRALGLCTNACIPVAKRSRLGNTRLNNTQFLRRFVACALVHTRNIRTTRTYVLDVLLLLRLLLLYGPYAIVSTNVCTREWCANTGASTFSPTPRPQHY